MKTLIKSNIDTLSAKKSGHYTKITVTSLGLIYGDDYREAISSQILTTVDEKILIVENTIDTLRTFVTDTNSQTVTLLEQEMTDLEGDILSSVESTAVTAVDTFFALSTLKTNIESQFGTNAANINTEMSTYATNNDVGAIAQVALDTDGRITGWTAVDSSSGGSAFKINADSFALSDATNTHTPFSIDAASGKVQFNGIVSFSNITNTQGSGTNLLYNSAPKLGSETKGWSVGWSNHGLSSSLGAGFDSWRPTGGASVYIVVPGNPTIGTVFDINNNTFPVIAGTRYEASAYISSHRCTSYVTLAWLDNDGNYIYEVGGSSVNVASSGQLANWGRSTLFATAPSNASTARFYVRSVVASDNPYCFVSYAYAGIASANQTIASNWSEGSSAGVSSTDVVSDINNGLTTTIDGGKITANAVLANDIMSQDITFTGTITGGNQAGGGVIQSYDGSMVIDLVNGSIYIA